MVKKILKLLLGLVILLILFAVIVYFKSVNYSMYSLNPDKEVFVDIKTDEDIDNLVGQLVSEMTLEELVQDM